MISTCMGTENLMCTCTQNFDSIAPHLELAILSRTFRITEHAQSSVEYFNLLLQNSVQALKNLHFYQVMDMFQNR